VPVHLKPTASNELFDFATEILICSNARLAKSDEWTASFVFDLCFLHTSLVCVRLIGQCLPCVVTCQIRVIVNFNSTLTIVRVVLTCLSVTCLPCHIWPYRTNSDHPIRPSLMHCSDLATFSMKICTKVATFSANLFTFLVFMYHPIRLFCLYSLWWWVAFVIWKNQRFECRVVSFISPPSFFVTPSGPTNLVESVASTIQYYAIAWFWVYLPVLALDSPPLQICT